MVKELFYQGRLTDKGEEYYRKKTIKKLEKEGYIKKGVLKVRFNSQPSTFRKGDLVITFEIHKVVGKFEPSHSHPSKNQFSVAGVLPICSIGECNRTGCEHKNIMETGEVQQGITKILKQRL